MQRRWDRGPQTSANSALAKTFLQALLGPPRLRQSGGNQAADWTCCSCKWSNFASRNKCRHCGAPPGTAGSKPPTPTVPAKAATTKPPPWERAKAAAIQAAALEAALTAAQQVGGAEDFEKELTEKLTAARRTAQDDRPLPDRLAGIRSYISRAEKRLDAAEKAVKEAEGQHEAIAADLTSHKAKLEELEREAEQQRKSAMETDEARQPASNPEPEELVQLREQMAQLSQEVIQLRQQNAAMQKAGKGLEVELSAARPELEAARAQKTAAERQHAELRALGLAELRTRLAKCFGDHQKALTEGRWPDAEALADMTGKLTAALRDAGEQEALAGSNFDQNS